VVRYEENEDPVWERYAHKTDGTDCLRRQLDRLQAIVDKWPRVYWYSANPDSLEKGYRVMSVSGKTEGDDVWLDVFVDCPGPDGDLLAAPDDFGLYRTREEAEAARAAEVVSDA